MTTNNFLILLGTCAAGALIISGLFGIFLHDDESETGSIITTRSCALLGAGLILGAAEVIILWNL
jgi:hypothetical protein